MLIVTVDSDSHTLCRYTYLFIYLFIYLLIFPSTCTKRQVVALTIIVIASTIAGIKIDNFAFIFHDLIYDC